MRTPCWILPALVLAVGGCADHEASKTAAHASVRHQTIMVKTPDGVRTYQVPKLDPRDAPEINVEPGADGRYVITFGTPNPPESTPETDAGRRIDAMYQEAKREVDAERQRIDALAAVPPEEQARLEADTSPKGMAFAEGYRELRRAVAGMCPDGPPRCSLVEGEPYAVRVAFPRNIRVTEGMRSVAATHWGALRIDEAKLIHETDDGKRLLSYSIDGAQ